jgi:hypothetical protein
MISFKKALFALGLGLGLSAGMNAWALPGCSSCEYMGNQCVAGDATACYNFDRLYCNRYGEPGAISCDVVY